MDPEYDFWFDPETGEPLPRPEYSPRAAAIMTVAYLIGLVIVPLTYWAAIGGIRA